MLGGGCLGVDIKRGRRARKSLEGGILSGKEGKKKGLRSWEQRECYLERFQNHASSKKTTALDMGLRKSDGNQSKKISSEEEPKSIDTGTKNAEKGWGTRENARRRIRKSQPGLGGN